MHTDRTTVPGEGAAHHLVTRAGERLCLMIDTRGTRHALVYDDLDAPARATAPDPGEAGRAEILQSQPIADRLASLAWQVSELMRERG